VNEEEDGMTPESSVELVGDVVEMPVESGIETPVVNDTEPVNSRVESLELPM